MNGHLGSFIVKNDLTKLIFIVSLAVFFGFRVGPLFDSAYLWAEDANILYGPSISELNNQTSGELLSSYKGQVFLFNILLAKAILFLIGDNFLILPFISTLVSVIAVPILSSIWFRKNALFQGSRYGYFVFGYILLSPASYEPLGNLANIATYLLFCCVALIGLPKPKTRRGFFCELILILLATFTGGIGIILFVVLFLRKFLTGYFPKVQIIVVSMSLLFQARGWLDRGTTQVNLIQDFSNVANILFKRIGAETLFGQTGGLRFDKNLPTNIWVSIGFTILLLFFVPMLMIYIKDGISESRPIFALAVVFCPILECSYSQIWKQGWIN